MIELAQRTVVHVLDRQAAERPDQVALVDAAGELTYAQLREQCCRAAGGLRDLGVGAGDRVALLMDNSIDHIVAWFATSCLNAVEVALNTALKPGQIAQIVQHSEPTVLITDAAHVPLVRAVADAVPSLKAVIVRGDADTDGLPFPVSTFADLAAHDPVEPERLAPHDLLGIVYTSGTTGLPKGVLVSQAQTYGRMWPGGPGTPGAGDRTLVVLPIYHVIGQCRGLYNTLIAGGTAVLEERFSASRFWDVARRHAITFVPLIGVMVTYLLRQPSRDDDRDHPVRHIALGTTSPQLEQFRERFGIAELSMSYGLTEAGGVLVGPAEPVGCGYLRPDFEARLVDEHDVDVPAGGVGELVLRPREPWTAMSGYYRMPDVTLERWRNLWLHTGDLMTQRADGMYLYAGRRADRIRIKGENVSPAEVEQVLAEHPAVADCAVTSVPARDTDAEVGEEEILAAVVAAQELDFADLAEFAASRLPNYAVPRYFARLPELPRTAATHRVQRSALAGLAAGATWDRLTPPREGPQWKR